MAPAKRKVLFVASECAPYAKAGGLGDVVGALPKVLVKHGYDVRILLPLYSAIDRARHRIHEIGSMCLHMGGGEEHWLGLHQTMLDDVVPVYFIDYARYFARPGIYGWGWDYPQDAYRFALLSKAALQLAVDLPFIPDVMHLHDWPTALTAAYLKVPGGRPVSSAPVGPLVSIPAVRAPTALTHTASVLTIHNVMYQGRFDAPVWSYTGVGWEHFNSGAFEDHGGVNLLKGGIHFADALTTVSPTHAQEILGAVGGHGLGPYLKAREADLTGILNGVDDDVWNPESDRFLPARYDGHDMHGKLDCKRALQKRFALDSRPDAPLFGAVSRFAEQKGFALVREALPRVLDAFDVQCVVLGSGDRATEDFFRDLMGRYPGRVGSYIGYSEDLAHLIEAGADFFLMPSLYEPCGLNQMYSMRYGTLPVVRATGGLADTVIDHADPSGRSTGFVFDAPSPAALHDVLVDAILTWFRRPGEIADLRRRAMARRFTWESSARAYLAVYERAIAARRATLVPPIPAESTRGAA